MHIRPFLGLLDPKRAVLTSWFYQYISQAVSKRVPNLLNKPELKMEQRMSSCDRVWPYHNYKDMVLSSLYPAGCPFAPASLGFSRPCPFSNVP